MKIKRFFSNDMRSAIRMVREELGSEAVILTNNRVKGGVEVVAAVDYDESIFAQNATESAKTVVPLDETMPYRASLSSSLNTQQQNQVPVGDAKSSLRSTETEQSKATQHSRPRGFSAQVCKQSLDEFDELSIQQKQQSDFGFYQLDDAMSRENTRVNNTLFDVDNVQKFPGNHKQHVTNEQGEGLQKDRRKSSINNTIWSQEPTLVEMRNELRSMRDLLEKQLSGLAWGDVARNNPLRAKLLRQLLELEISPALAGKIAEVTAKRGNVDPESNYEQTWQMALMMLMRQLPTFDDDLITQGGVVALVGPTGVGKTTTVAKLAARYALRHGRNNVALVTTDGFRIAAHEQLRTYGRILGIPVRVASNKEEMIDILKSFSDKDLVLIDTAGMSHRDMRLIEQFSLIADCTPVLKSLLVLSTTTHRAGLDEIVRVFRNVQLDGCVLTKLDETAGLASVLSVIIEQQIPVAYVSNGQKVPEDLHLARPHSLINQSVLIARKPHQVLDNESLELAFSRVMSNANF